MQLRRRKLVTSERKREEDEETSNYIQFSAITAAEQTLSADTVFGVT